MAWSARGGSWTSAWFAAPPLLYVRKRKDAGRKECQASVETSMEDRYPVPRHSEEQRTRYGPQTKTAVYGILLYREPDTGHCGSLRILGFGSRFYKCGHPP